MDHIPRVALLLVAALLSVAGDSLPPPHGVVNWLLFPGPSSSIGLFLALAVPLDLVNQDVALSFNFEGNYAVPANVTLIEEYMEEYGFKRSLQARKARELDTLRNFGRVQVYEMIENSISRSGKLSGRACLLRAVCEAAEWPMEQGLLGGVLHVLLTPSSSNDLELPPEYRAAERHGLRGAACSELYKECPISLLGLLTEQ